MNIAVSTGVLYQETFQKTLELIKKAGFDYIELLTYWYSIDDKWEIGSNLKKMSPGDVLTMIKDSGLKISSLHDSGGIIYSEACTLISESTYNFLEYAANEIPCIVLHTPQKKTFKSTWWKKECSIYGNEMKELGKKTLVCIENVIEGYGHSVSMMKPKELLEFATEYEIYVNVDTSNFMQSGIDITEAARILKDRVKTVHLSDYARGEPYMFIGDGSLDFQNFFDTLDISILHSVTLECKLDYNYFQDGYEEYIVKRLKMAKLIMESLMRQTNRYHYKGY